MFEEDAEKRKKSGKTIGTNSPNGRSRGQASQVFKVGEKQVQQAKAILLEGK
jgi:hypothetical protein